jgi:hypothetical protein
VTQTANQTGEFDARFFHVIFQEEFARIKGHFGPINTLAFHPDDQRFVSYSTPVILLFPFEFLVMQVEVKMVLYEYIILIYKNESRFYFCYC